MADSRQFLDSVPGSWDISSVVYGGLKALAVNDATSPQLVAGTVSANKLNAASSGSAF